MFPSVALLMQFLCFARHWISLFTFDG
jgi:hypothetical protein